MDDDRILFDWIRHYLTVILACVVAGVVLAAAMRMVLPRQYEAWIVLVQRGDKISALELGPTAKAVFLSEAVYGPVLDRLGTDMSPQTFFDLHAELRPIPETDTLIVIGRSKDPAEAGRIADLMTDAFVQQFQERRLARFSLFGRVVPVERGASPPVIVALGAVVGFWVGLSASVIHYRVRRPVLTLRRAVALTGAGQVTVVDARGRRWLGALRRPRRLRPRSMGPDGPVPLARALQAHHVGSASLRGDSRLIREVRRSVAPVAQPPASDGRRSVVVAHAGTGERSVQEGADGVGGGEARAAPVDLVWVR